MLQNEAYVTIVNYDCEPFIVQATDYSPVQATIVKYFVVQAPHYKLDMRQVRVSDTEAGKGLRPINYKYFHCVLNCRVVSQCVCHILPCLLVIYMPLEWAPLWQAPALVANTTLKLAESDEDTSLLHPVVSYRTN